MPQNKMLHISILLHRCDKNKYEQYWVYIKTTFGEIIL